MSKPTMTIGLLVCALGCTAPQDGEPPAAATEAGQSAGAETPAEQPPPAPASDTVAAAEQSKKILATFEAFNAGDLDGSLAAASFEVELSVIGGETLKGKGHVRRHWEGLRKGFPDMKRNVRRVIHTGETIAVEYVVTGTHTGEFAGHAASQQTIGYDALMIFHSDQHSSAHEVTRITLYEDEIALLRQIGAAEGEAPPKSGPPVGAPEMVEGDGDRALVDFIKAWYAAIGPNWNQACDKTYCTDDVAFYSMPDGQSLVKQMDRARYLDLLVEGAKDLQVADVWVEPAGKYFVTFTTWKRIRPSVSLGLAPSDKLIDLSVAQVILVQDGKLKEVSTYFNRRQALAQLGK